DETGRILRRVQLSGGDVSGISQQSLDSSSRRTGDLSPPNGLEVPVDLWRQLRRTLPACGKPNSVRLSLNNQMGPLERAAFFVVVGGWGLAFHYGLRQWKGAAILLAPLPLASLRMTGRKSGVRSTPYRELRCQ